MKKNAEMFLRALDRRYYLNDDDHNHCPQNSEMLLRDMEDRNYCDSHYRLEGYVARVHKGEGYCLGCDIPRKPYQGSFGEAFDPLWVVPTLLIIHDIDPNDFAKAVARVDGKKIDDGLVPIIWLKDNHYLGVTWCGLDRDKVCKALELL